MVSSSQQVLLRVREVSARTRLSRTSIYRLVRAGNFPPPVATGVRLIAWRSSDIDDWMVALAATGNA
jgi:prophage regulatory protein